MRDAMRAVSGASPYRWAMLPPLMIYLAAGLSGLTSIAGTFFVKDRLGLSAEFIASLGFWATLPWSLKLALAHLVDLVWRYRAWLVVLGALFVAMSLVIVLGLLAHRDGMARWMRAESWYVLSALLAPLGYVLQDVVADAMSVDAVPRVNADGQQVDEAQAKHMHTVMQSLGRGTLIAGTVVVSLVNIFVFTEASGTGRAGADMVYLQLYRMALIFPCISVLGIVLARIAQVRLHSTHWHAPAPDPQRARSDPERAKPDRLILGGGLAMAGVSAWLGLSGLRFAELLVFLLSLIFVVVVLARLLRAIARQERNTLIGTALLIFAFRAMPDAGPAPTWWIIDQLGADEAFFSRLALIGGLLAMLGLWLFRRFMAQQSVASSIVALTLLWTVLSLPAAGMYCCNLHEWLSRHTNGMMGGRAIVFFDTSSMSLVSEIAMVPMLAWIARTAPEHLKATYFAVMLSLSNLSLSLSRLGTQYLNHVFVITRQTHGGVSGSHATSADYSHLGALYAGTLVLAAVIPLCTVVLLRHTRFRSA